MYRSLCFSLVLLCSVAFTTSVRGEISGTTFLDSLSGTSGRVVSATFAPGRPDELFVVEQTGRIHRLDLATGQFDNTVFLDIAGFVDDGGNEQGLLGLAFDPDYANNGHFYVNYTRDPGPGRDRTRIDRFTVPDPLNSTTVSSGTRMSVLEFEQDFSNHNGGWIGFSPKDNYLYIASGDGGSGNDPNNRGQSLNTLLGKMLRIDPSGDDFPVDPIKNYSIPADNPFVDGNSSTFDEIWAYGLRNPWRSSFDRETGDLWIGDVGQNAREEINFQPADGTGGENYGWAVREGFIAGPKIGVGPFVDPVYDYPSNGSGQFGGNSVVGGYVYRGPDPEVQGRYFFADSFPTQLWTFDPADPVGTVQNVESILSPSGQINTPYSFAEDFHGNLYILDGLGVSRIDTDAIAGDFDGDGRVDAADYTLWRSSFGQTGEDLGADGNGDGTVDAADYTMWRDNLGFGTGGSLNESLGVPEPAGLFLMFVGLVFAVSLRHSWRP